MDFAIGGQILIPNSEGSSAGAAAGSIGGWRALRSEHGREAHHYSHTTIAKQSDENIYGLQFRICGLYERKIRDINPMARDLTYDINDLYNFIDGLTDISALVFDRSLHAFLPYDRRWIKQEMFQHLKRLAQQ
uniref:Enhancer of rudimentary homolog n=1 Tax=Oryza nivara TaxID=4536 RepID=A0A0E0H2R3_ORYNI